MNFLAHLYLSGDDDDLMIGNFIGDHIRGNAIDQLPQRIRMGVLLHRKIDQFTDQHPVVRQTRISIRSHFGKYSVVASDLFYDHFLASLWSEYSTENLQNFADAFYRKIADYGEIIPDRTKHMLGYMIPHNWLVSYATLEGIGKAMKGMSKRTSFPSGMEKGEEVLRAGYEMHEQEFRMFFPELVAYVRKQSEQSLIKQ